ncbi:MAG: PAS domain-containing protein [Gemmatimonadales bacterium]
MFRALLKFFQSAVSPSAIIVDAAKAQDTTDAAVIGCDARGTIVYWNDQAATLFGWPSTDAVGRSLLDVLPTHNGESEPVSIVDELRRGTPWRGQFVVRARDGTPIVTFISNTPVTAGKRVVGVVSVSRRERRRSSRGSGESRRAD